MNIKQDDFISISDILEIIKRGKIIILISVLFSFFLAFSYLLIVQHKYIASINVGPNDNSLSGISQSAGISSLSSFSDILGDKPTGQYSDFIELLSSEIIAAELLKDEKVLSVIFSSEWNAKTKTLERPESIIQFLNSLKGVFGRPAWTPPDEKSLNRKIKSNLTLTPIGETEIQKISFAHPDPKFAVYLLDQLINITDTKIQSKKLEQVIRNIEYIKKRLNEELFIEVRNELAKMLGAQEKQKMLLESDTSYSYKKYDNSRVSNSPLKPNIISVLVLGAIIGLFSGLLISFIRFGSSR